jgi:hypothetical protein
MILDPAVVGVTARAGMVNGIVGSHGISAIERPHLAGPRIHLFAPGIILPNAHRIPIGIRAPAASLRRMILRIYNHKREGGERLTGALLLAVGAGLIALKIAGHEF